MKIADNHVVFMTYTLTDDDGVTIDSNVGGEPMPYLHGGNNIVPGLEKSELLSPLSRLSIRLVVKKYLYTVLTLCSWVTAKVR